MNKKDDYDDKEVNPLEKTNYTFRNLDEDKDDDDDDEESNDTDSSSDDDEQDRSTRVLTAEMDAKMQLNDRSGERGTRKTAKAARSTSQPYKPIAPRPGPVGMAPPSNHNPQQPTIIAIPLAQQMMQPQLQNQSSGLQTLPPEEIAEINRIRNDLINAANRNDQVIENTPSPNGYIVVNSPPTMYNPQQQQQQFNNEPQFDDNQLNGDLNFDDLDNLLNIPMPDELNNNVNVNNAQQGGYVQVVEVPPPPPAPVVQQQSITLEKLICQMEMNLPSNLRNIFSSRVQHGET